jgi:hypothetical protein
MKGGFKSKFNLNCLFSKKTLVFVSLFFMATLFFSPIIPKGNGWLGVPTGITVETETELVNAISTAPNNEKYVIHISKDIVLTKSLEIPCDKDIFLIGYDRDICLVGADGRDTIVVRSKGLLTVYGRITVTHAEGETGRGVYIERDGTLDLAGAIISGNSADKGGGVYNVGTLSVGGFEDRDSLIVNNVATLGGGVYNKGTFEVKSLYGQIHGNTSPSGEDNNVFNEEPTGSGQFYLLAIAAVAVLVIVVGGLFFLSCKKTKVVSSDPFLVDSLQHNFSTDFSLTDFGVCGLSS